MTTFTPPTEPGTPRSDDILFNHYQAIESGVTVWKDQEGVWHQNQFPYAGRPDFPGLTQAQYFFLGGHTYEVSTGVALELINAGYADYLNTTPVDNTWFKQSDLTKFTEWLMTQQGNGTYATRVVNDQLEIYMTAGPQQFLDSNRRFFVHSDTTLNDDFDASLIIDPQNYSISGITEQQGVCLRTQQSGGLNTGITINNNVFFIVPHCNIGVWKSNTDGTGFASRSVPLEIGLLLSFPHHYDIRLRDNIITVRVYEEGLAAPAWDDPTYAMTVDLDTAGTPAEIANIPTPVGEGGAGLIAAHLGTDPLVIARYRGFKVGPSASLFGQE